MKLSTKVLNIKVDGSSAARIVVNIEGEDKVALIDTGAGRCCMNEEQYRTSRSPPLESQDVGFQLRTTSGALMPGMGFLTCDLGIGGETYKQQFIVCWQLTPGYILGCDFLSCNQLGITWGPEGTLQLKGEQDPSVQTAEEMTNPTVKLAAKTVIPPRSLVLVTVLTTLPPCKDKTHFDFVPTQINSHLGPNCIVYPLDYASIKGGLQKGLQILINLGQQDIKLQQGLVLGHYQKAPFKEIMITQEDIFWSECRGTLGTWGSGGGGPKRKWKRFYHFSRGYRSSGAHQIEGCRSDTGTKESI